jgi:hypothetical protein
VTAQSVFTLLENNTQLFNNLNITK